MTLLIHRSYFRKIHQHNHSKYVNKHPINFLDVVVFYHKKEINRIENGVLFCKLA